MVFDKTTTVILEDLEPDKFYVIDVRATNKFGYSNQPSKLLAVKTLSSRRGNLYSWGNNTNAELCYGQEDTANTKYYNNEKH